MGEGSEKGSFSVAEPKDGTCPLLSLPPEPFLSHWFLMCLSGLVLSFFISELKNFISVLACFFYNYPSTFKTNFDRSYKHEIDVISVSDCVKTSFSSYGAPPFC